VRPKLRVIPLTQLLLDEKNANKGTKVDASFLKPRSKSMVPAAPSLSTVMIV